VLVVLQTALSTVMLVGAGLTILTLHRLESLDAGFERSRVVTFSLDPEMAKYTPEQATDLKRRLLSRALALPDVESAAISSRGLMRGTGLKMTVARAGERAGPEQFMNTSIHAVSPEYFSTMGIPLRSGRNFTGRENPVTTPKPVIVNETFMKRFGGERVVLGAMFGSVRVNGAPAQSTARYVNRSSQSFISCRYPETASSCTSGPDQRQSRSCHLCAEFSLKAIHACRGLK
jgi:hypothetical protein